MAKEERAFNLRGSLGHRTDLLRSLSLSINTDLCDWQKPSTHQKWMLWPVKVGHDSEVFVFENQTWFRGLWESDMIQRSLIIGHDSEIFDNWTWFIARGCKTRRCCGWRLNANSSGQAIAHLFPPYPVENTHPNVFVKGMITSNVINLEKF